MTKPHDIERLIVDAIEDSHDGVLDEKRLEEVRTLLKTSSEARRAYLKHNQLSQHLASEESGEIPFEIRSAASNSGKTASGVESIRAGRRMFYVAFAVASVALAVLVSVLLQPVDDIQQPSVAGTGSQIEQQDDESQTEGTEPTQPMAVLTRAIDVEWQHRTRFKAQLGKPIPQGWLRLQSGVIEVSFNSGATVTLEGPARLRIDSSMQVVSQSGILTANCPPSAYGFTVKFPGGKVVDLGTEFALNTEPKGRTQVHVLNGEVIVALTDGEENVLKKQNLKGSTAVELNPDDQAIRNIVFDTESYSGLQREELIRTQPIKLQFDLGHRAGLYKGTNSPAHATGAMHSHESVWTQIVGDQSGAFVMADGNICPHPIRVDYGHGDGVIDWDATPEDPWGRVYSKAAGVFATSLCQDHRPWDYDLGLRVSGLPAGKYRVYALCRSVRRPEAAYNISFGVNLDRQQEQPRFIPPMNPMETPMWVEGKTYVMDEVTVSGPKDWATFITRYDRQRSIKSTPHHGRSVLLGLQIVQLTQSNSTPHNKDANASQ